MSVRSVLVVDKNRQWHSRIERVIKEAFPEVATVETATTGYDALRIAKKGAFDLYISAVAYQLRVGTMDLSCSAGIYFVNDLRRMKPNANIILVSDNADLEGIAGGLGVPYIPKPGLSPEKLRQHYSVLAEKVQ